MLSISNDAFAVDCGNTPGGLDPASDRINYQCTEIDRHAAGAKLNRIYKKLQSDIKRKQSSRCRVRFENQYGWRRAAMVNRQSSIVNHSECLTELTDARPKALQDSDKAITEQ
ncbi:MAG: hypothetical protein V4801_12030 [Burkholderia gladioli]